MIQSYDFYFIFICVKKLVLSIFYVLSIKFGKKYILMLEFASNFKITIEKREVDVDYCLIAAASPPLARFGTIGSCGGQ